MKQLLERFWRWADYTYRRLIIVILATAVALAAIVYGVIKIVTPAPPCGGTHGISQPTGTNQCIGVTDGSFTFSSSLEPIERRILAENRQVEKQGSYVTVAYLGPLTVTNVPTMQRVRTALEGAYIAQRDANSAGRPPIRLVLANDGGDTSQWRPVVGQLEEMNNGSDHLVAVIGLQLSTTGTRSAAQHLTQDHIPVVGDLISADTLDGSTIPGLSRVSPPNKLEVEGLSQYATGHPQNPDTVLLVDDENATDLYTSTLAADFRASFKGHIVLTEPYDGQSQADIDFQFQQIIHDLCSNEPPNTVLYAGRVELLPRFVRQLANRACGTGKTITVITGDDGTALPQSSEVAATLRNPDNAPVSVIYTSVNDPQVLSGASNPAHHLFTTFEQEFTGAGFRYSDLQDEAPVLAHDALLSVAQAEQNRAGKPTSPITVGGRLREMNTSNSYIPGAGGAFEFDVNGNPVCQRLLLLQLTAGGGTTPRYLGSWPIPTPGNVCPSP